MAQALAIVRRDGLLLLVRPAGQGAWGFPCGPVGLGQPLAEAALQALAAAGDVTAEPSALLPPLDAIERHQDGSLRAHRVLFPVLCRWRAGQGAGPAAAFEAGWWGQPAITGLLPPELAPLVARALADGPGPA